MQQNLFRFTGYAAAFLLPLALVWLSPIYGLIAWAIGFLAFGKLAPKIWPMLLFAAFVDWELIAVYWSDNRPAGWADVVMVLPFGLMGVLANGLTVEDPQRWGRRFADAFAWATTLCWTAIFGYSLVTYGWVSYNDFALGERLGIHFQSLYLIIAALILERRIWSEPKGVSWASAVAVLWLLVGIIFLSARIHLLTVPVLIMARLFELYRRNPSWRKHILRWGTIALAVLGAMVLTLPGPSSRVEDLINEMRSVDGMVEGKQTNHRIFLWKYGMDIIQEAPLLGVGNGHGEDVLHEKLLTCDAKFYNKKEPYYLHEFRYDFHNVWIQSWAEGGIIAFLLMAGIFLWGLT
ncbi:MAG: O-antigen ligase family protein, partial [Schleiferiaceae bacterium]